MTTGLRRFSVRSAQRSWNVGTDMRSASGREVQPAAGPGDFSAGRPESPVRPPARAAAGAAACSTSVSSQPTGGFRGLARHDVLQLLLVDGLVLHECVGHDVQLVEAAVRICLARW